LPRRNGPVVPASERRNQPEWEEMVKLKIKSLTGFAAATLVAGGMVAASGSAQAETIAQLQAEVDDLRRRLAQAEGTSEGSDAGSNPIGS